MNCILLLPRQPESRADRVRKRDPGQLNRNAGRVHGTNKPSKGCSPIMCGCWVEERNC